MTFEQQLMMKIDFPHKAPRGYSYEQTEFKRNVIAIWIRNHSKFDYNGGAPVKSIWGFYNTKTRSYYAPINSSKQGDEVRIEDTTPYSAMQLNLNPLEQAFV
jgi:hypothetical protein